MTGWCSVIAHRHIFRHPQRPARRRRPRAKPRPRCGGEVFSSHRAIKEKARGPVSRVLSAEAVTAIHLKTSVARRLLRPTRKMKGLKTSPALRRIFPIWSCSRRGFPCLPCCQGSGALLPHHFTLTAKSGGIFSAALSLRSPSPDVIRRRVFMEPGLSSKGEPLRGRPALWRSHPKRKGRQKQV